MEKGCWIEKERIKADATPVDDVTKFAWDDDDYEKVREWVDYTPEEIAAMEAQEAEVAKKAEQDALLEQIPAYFTALTSAFGEVE